DLRRALDAFVVERYPFAASAALEALTAVDGKRASGEAAIDALREPFAAALRARLAPLLPSGVGETTPGVAAPERFGHAVEEIVSACDGCLRRAAIRASLTSDERVAILRATGLRGR